MRPRAVWLAPLFSLLGCLDPAGLGNLVPATADQDPALPQLEVEVAGHRRILHLETFGDPTDPPLFILHGSACDYRSMRPIAVELSERYFVVIWDQRGAGLSERIGADEFSLDSAVAEIDAIKAIHAPDRPISLLGHSWGGGLAALYAGRHPERVHQLVLSEPMPLDGARMNDQIDEILQFEYFNEGWNDQARLDELLASDGHEALDYRAALLLHTGLTNYFCDRDNPPPLPIWRVGGYLEYLRNRTLRPGTSFTYDFTPGLENFAAEVLFVAGECGGLGAAFQAEQLDDFPAAHLVEIADTGHRLYIERPDAYYATLKDYLDQYTGLP
jgi:proline iminopeptidase